jgi:thymidine kinase
MKLLRVFAGPVHSGKTKRALTLTRRLLGLGHDVVVVRPEAARREHEEPGFIVTKDGESWPCIELIYPEQLVEAAEGCTTFWLDEPHFFEPEEDKVFGALQEIRKTADVIVTGCAATDKLEALGLTVMRCMAVADEVIWCRSDCRSCGREDGATRSFYIGKGQKAKQVKKGGESDYAALCPACWSARTEARKREEGGHSKGMPAPISSAVS